MYHVEFTYDLIRDTAAALCYPQNKVMYACLLNHHDTLKSREDIALSSTTHHVTSETKSWGRKEVTNIWFSNFSKERTNKRTEIGKKITKVNTLYKEKEKTVNAVILPLSYAWSFYTLRATAILTLLRMWQQVNRLSYVWVLTLHHILCE